MTVRIDAFLLGPVAGQLEELEARAIARARDLVERPASSSALLELQDALRARSELLLAASAILKAYGRSADQIVAHLEA